MPLAADAYAEKSPPMLTCLQRNDGFQFELMIQVANNEAEITKVRIGPYHFRKQFKPRPMFGGRISRGGPENAIWMHKCAPAGWSRIRWEVAHDEPDSPAYLTWEGRLRPGSIGVFRFISLFKPGGLRAGLCIHRGASVEHLGVTGPNYERFEVFGH